MDLNKKEIDTPISTPTIQNTKDYGLFKFLIENRNIRGKHIKTLVRSIKICNLLPICPILVNSKYYILDGQHRLRAAQQLDREIYYIIVPDTVSYILLNTTHKNWDLLDYTNYYASLGHPSYIALLDMSEEYHMTINLIKHLMQPSDGSGPLEKFKRGLFTYDFENIIHHQKCKFYNHFKKVCINKRVKPSSIYMTKACTGAIAFIIESNKFDLDRFIERIGIDCDELRYYPTTYEFLQVLINIYNKRLSYKITLQEVIEAYKANSSKNHKPQYQLL